MTTTKTLLTCAASAALATPSFAHDGHGLMGTHWHATDVIGFVIAIAIGAIAIWTSRK
ncbi:hypothetical protein [Hydrogenophaga sp. 5NK40-0174]|uniref:hypothetical protein n=1 Tax=Hydrogenophaga sp. 5NK40-0174 TaxID=3127649 RepID=UPI0031059940